MTEKIILSVVSIVMLAFTLQKGDKRWVLLTAGLTVGVLMTWCRVKEIMIFAGAIYMIVALIAAIVNVGNQNLTKLDKTTIVSAAVWAFGLHLFSIMHWPYSAEIQLSSIIPIILFAISLPRGMINRKELGYLTILNTEFILRLIQ